MSFVALAGTIGAGATALLGGMGMATGVGSLGAAIGSGIGAVGAGALGGAGLGALGSAITGGDVGKGALYGALGGGLSGGLSSAVGSIGGAAAPGATTAATPVASGSSSLVGQGAQAATNLIGTPIQGEIGSNIANLTNVGREGLYGAGAQNLQVANALSPVNTLGKGSLLAQDSLRFAEPFAGGPTTVVNPNSGWSMGNVFGGSSPIVNTPIDVTDKTLRAASNELGRAAAPSYAGTLFGQHPLMAIGAGSMLGSYLGGNSGPTQATPPNQEWNPLSFYKFNPKKFKPQPAGYTGYLYNPTTPTYLANGGIASLNPNPSMMQGGPAKVDFMGQDAYPTSQQKLSFYSSPTQMPTSAQQAAASYEPATNPLTGEPMAHFSAGGISDLGAYSDGGQLTRGPGDGVSDDIPATIAGKQPARLADGEFVIPARAVSELGNGSTEAGAKRLYDMVDRIQNKRKKSMGRKNIAVDSKARAALPV